MTNFLITGANRGIGAELAVQARGAGHGVIGTSRKDLDVTNPESVARFAASIAGRDIDVLICNAGVFSDKGLAFEDYDMAVFAEVMAVNVAGVFATIQALLPNLRASHGKIAVISSDMASSQRANGGSYAYRASKAAVTNLVRNLAIDLRGDGIALAAYHPGWVVTDMGGSDAEINVETSACGLLARIEHLSLASSGAFESYEGSEMPF